MKTLNYRRVTRYFGYILLATSIFYIGWNAGGKHTYNKTQWLGCYDVTYIEGNYHNLAEKFERTDSMVANNWIIYMTIKYDGESIHYYYDKKFVQWDVFR